MNAIEEAKIRLLEAENRALVEQVSALKSYISALGSHGMIPNESSLGSRPKDAEFQSAQSSTQPATPPLCLAIEAAMKSRAIANGLKMGSVAGKMIHFVAQHYNDGDGVRATNSSVADELRTSVSSLIRVRARLISLKILEDTKLEGGDSFSYRADPSILEKINT